MLESATASAAPRRLTFLGSGTSSGVRTLGCDCAVCRSDDPRNWRTRPSVLIALPGGNLLVDTTPEMRIQLLRERVRTVHAIAFTHAHADHMLGLDDVRAFPKQIGGPVPVYCTEETETAIRRVFYYAFTERLAALPPGHVPKLQFERIAPGVPVTILGEPVVPIRLEHGRMEVLGLRIADLAYCTDVSKIPEASWPLLEGLDTLILDALRHEPHPTHFSLGEALEVFERVRPRKMVLTHLSHAFDHGPTESTLPPSVTLAYDGLTLNF